MFVRTNKVLGGVSRPTSRLAAAVGKGNLSAARRALKKGADPNCPGLEGGGLLTAAVYGGNLGIVVALVEAGADVNLASRYGNTPADIAAEIGNRELVKYLMEYGANRYADTYRGADRPVSAPATTMHGRSICRYIRTRWITTTRC